MFKDRDKDVDYYKVYTEKLYKFTVTGIIE